MYINVNNMQGQSSGIFVKIDRVVRDVESMKREHTVLNHNYIE